VIYKIKSSVHRDRAGAPQPLRSRTSLMDDEVLRVVMEIAAFFVLAAAGIGGFRFAGFGMAALGVALAVPAMDALDYADNLHLFRCDGACTNRGGWQFTEDAWQWDALWITALAGTITLWLSVVVAVAAGGTGAFRRVRLAARHVHVVAAVAMAIAVASFGAFTLIVAPLGDQYGI
jgi:hypothetical protein